MNREQRRHPEREDAQHVGPKPAHEESMRGQNREQDDSSVRAKNSGGKKKTAAKWNQ